MSYLAIERCNLEQLAELDKLDMLATVVGAVCHDLGHDGYTN